MKVAILFWLLLAVPIYTQAPVEPVRVALIIPADTETNIKLGAEVRTRLKALGRVQFVTQRADFEVFIAATPHCGEFVSALHVFEKRGPGRMDIYAGPDLPTVADYLVKELDARFRPRAQGDSEQ